LFVLFHLTVVLSVRHWFTASDNPVWYLQMFLPTVHIIISCSCNWQYLNVITIRVISSITAFCPVLGKSYTIAVILFSSYLSWKKTYGLSKMHRRYTIFINIILDGIQINWPTHLYIFVAAKVHGCVSSILWLSITTRARLAASSVRFDSVLFNIFPYNRLDSTRMSSYSFNRIVNKLYIVT
jgi:hypothetical protein